MLSEKTDKDKYGWKRQFKFIETEHELVITQTLKEENTHIFNKVWMSYREMLVLEKLIKRVKKKILMKCKKQCGD